MGYVEDNLQANESVVHRAVLHWIIFVPGILILIIGSLIVGALISTTEFTGIALGCALGLLLSPIIWAIIRRWTTEMAVTNRRVILKIGLIARRTIELNLDKVENISIDQSVLGRILGYGSMIVVGTGGSREPFTMVANPLGFRRAVQAQSAK